MTDVGEYATDSHAFYITDNLEIRYKQLQSKSNKILYTETARQTTKWRTSNVYLFKGNASDTKYTALEITADGEIHRYFTIN